MLSETTLKSLIPLLMLEADKMKEDEGSALFILTCVLDWIVTDGIGTPGNLVSEHLSKRVLEIESKPGLKEQSAYLYEMMNKSLLRKLEGEI